MLNSQVSDKMADNDMPAARTIGIIAKPVAVKVAQTVGLTTAAFLAGKMPLIPNNAGC